MSTDKTIKTTTVKSAVGMEFKSNLWAMADKLRNQMDPGEYKHLVLGLIFLKYISDTFQVHRNQIEKTVSDKASDYFVSEEPAEYLGALEDRDYYTKDNVFWVPAVARWETIRSQAKQSNIGLTIDTALIAIEKENDVLRGKLDKRFGAAQLEPSRLGELVDLISKIGFDQGEKAQDILGEVYEYFLGQFASAEGKKGGQFYTPASVVKILVAILSPHQGRVYDPCCGSGGMFVQSERFVKSHGGRVDDISIYGQESNPTTWRLAAMNLSIRGFYADLGKEPADTFAKDQFPDVKFDYVLANPPFNISDWGGERYESDARWQYGRPPVGNANYAWLQHILWKLKPSGQAGIVLANGSMSSNTSGEGQIREAMIKGDVVDIMVALPTQLFVNTQIPACLWFLSKKKTDNRKGKVLFIDARKMGTMDTRVHKVFTQEDIDKLHRTAESWRKDDGYEDIPGYCKSASLAEIEENGFVLTPGRYVGAEDVEDDGEPFDEKMTRLVGELKDLLIQGQAIDQHITQNLMRLGYE